MKKFENLIEWYHYLIDYLNEKKVTFFIHGSTLLGAVRNNALLERIPFDNEINFGMRAEDISQEFLSDLKKDFPYFNPTGDKKENALIYFGPEPIIDLLAKNQSHWEMSPGFALIATFWKTPDKWVEYMGNNACLTWPRYQLDQFSVMELAGRRVSTPFDRHAWLAHYFGNDYMFEHVSWHWATDSHNMEKYKDCF